MSNKDLLNELGKKVNYLERSLHELEESVYCTGFQTRNKNAEIKVGPDSSTLKGDRLSINDSNGETSLTSQTLLVDGVDILKTLANLIIPATPVLLLNFLNNPVDTKKPGQLFLKNFLYWYIVYNFTETNIPIQADIDATYYANYFKYTPTNNVKIEISGYIPYAQFISFTVYDRLTGDPALVIEGNDFKMVEGSENPFKPGNLVYTPLESRKYSFSIGTEDDNDFKLVRLDGAVLVFRVYGAYKYAPIGLPNDLESTKFPNDPTNIPIDLISEKSKVNNPSYVFYIDGEEQGLDLNKAPPPVLGHLLTRPFPNKKYPNPFYRLSNVEIPYGDGAPLTGKSNYLASFLEIGKESGYVFEMELPSVFNKFTLTTNTKYENFDVGYISVSVYSYQSLFNYSISASDMLKYNTTKIFLIPVDKFKQGILSGTIKGNVMDPDSEPKLVLPFYAGQQNIVIIRYKAINPDFTKSVKNVPVSNITLTGSLTDPEKYIANSEELGKYLPTLTPLDSPII